MGKRLGSDLEERVAELFLNLGFKVLMNTTRFGFETDVYAEIPGCRIIIECKEYKNAYLNIGALLHQWASKGQMAGVDRTIIVISGHKISSRFYKKAKELGVYLFSGDLIEELHNAPSRKDAFYRLNNLIRFDEEKYQKYIQEKRLRELKVVTLFVGIIGAFVLLLKLLPSNVASDLISIAVIICCVVLFVWLILNPYFVKKIFSSLRELLDIMIFFGEGAFGKKKKRKFIRRVSRKGRRR